MPNYTQENARTRSLNDARVSGRKVPLLPRGSHTKETYRTVNDRRFVTSYGPRTLLYLELPRGQPIGIRT